MHNLRSTGRMTFLSSLILISCSACGTEWLKKVGYETSNNYVCEEQGPNLPEQVRKCKETKMSYEEYQAARAKTLSNE